MGVPRVWAIKRDHGAPLGKRGKHGDGLVVARAGVLVVVGGGVRGHHRRQHRRLHQRQGGAVTGHHRPTRAYPGHPGEPQSVWCVGLGRGGLPGYWRARFKSHKSRVGVEGLGGAGLENILNIRL